MVEEITYSLIQFVFFLEFLVQRADSKNLKFLFYEPRTKVKKSEL
jgi:hypothetical protein